MKGSEAEAAAWQPGTMERSTHQTHQIAALLDDFERGARPEARQTIEFLSALYRSAATRQPVARGSIRKGDPFYEHVAGTLALQPAGAGR